jgi:hypothetical protein
MVTLQSFYTLVAIEEEFVHLAAEVHQKWRHESGSNDLQFPVGLGIDQGQGRR